MLNIHESQFSNYKQRQGIYLLVNTYESRRYIGLASLTKKGHSFCQRWRQHWSDFRNNSHVNLGMQEAWNKHGEESFELTILEDVPLQGSYDENRSHLNHLEEKWIKKYDTLNPLVGYNLMASTVLTEETLQKRSATRRRGKNAHSMYKGVGPHGSKWGAFANHPDGSRLWLGSYDTAEEAAMVFDWHMLQIYGGNVYLNFPDHDYDKYDPPKKLYVPGYIDVPRKYKGVYYHADKKLYDVRININRQSTRIGYFADRIAAAKERDYYVCLLELKAKLNFPEIDYKSYEPLTSKQIICQDDGRVTLRQCEKRRPTAAVKKTIAGRRKIKNHGVKYKGVSYRKDVGRFRAILNTSSGTIRLGTFDTPEEAARCYDQRALQEFGEGNCYLNFPNYDDK